MRTKTLVVLAGLTLAAGAGAFYAAQQRNAPDAAASMQNQPVLPGLAARIDGLARVEIERGGKLTGQIKTIATGATMQVTTTTTAAAKPSLSAQEVKARAAAKEFAA